MRGLAGSGNPSGTATTVIVSAIANECKSIKPLGESFFAPENLTINTTHNR